MSAFPDRGGWTRRAGPAGGGGFRMPRGKDEMNDLLNELEFDDRGLIPAVVQDAETQEVLMLAYMNREALEQTLATGRTVFWSRSRNCLWRKGETSGNAQAVRAVRVDCDADALLVEVDPAGPACHTGEPTCFHRTLSAASPRPAGLGGVIARLTAVIRDRRRHPKEGSYTCRLFDGGRERILKKVGEEAFEVALASVSGERGQIVYETADLIYHLLVLLAQEGIDPGEIADELARRSRT